MNRNLMYNILKEKGLYPIIRHHRDRRTYHTEFVVQNHQDCSLILDWGYIRHIKRISLCSSEIVVEGEYTDMMVNINYKDLENVEVRIIEE